MRICFFGDSFVNGTGDPACLGWVGRLCQGRAMTAYNLGIRGDTSLDVARRWRAEAAARLPAATEGRLVFSFGANDAAQGIDPTVTLATAEAILVEARAWCPTLMVGPPPIADSPEANRRLRSMSALLAARCRGLGVPCLEVFDPLDADDAWRREALMGDGAHPGEGGYAALAALVAQWEAWREA